MKKKALSLALTLIMSLSLSVPALAWESWQEGQDYMTAFNYYKENHMLTASADPIGATTHTNVYEIDGTYDEEVVDVYIFPANTTFTPCENWSWTGYSDLGAEVGTRNTVTLTGTDIYYLGMLYLDPNNGSLGMISFYLTAADSPAPTTPPAVTVENIPSRGMAKASTQSVEVDGKKVEFQMYALLDANGNSTNYVKLRDLAHVLNGTKAQFSVGYDGTIFLTTGQPYQNTGSEMTTPFSGDRAYTGGGQSVKINGSSVEMTAINLLDNNGGGYNYFKLRDLGIALGFNVGWSAERGIFVETDKPYTA